jgi:hypothetical protein
MSAASVGGTSGATGPEKDTAVGKITNNSANLLLQSSFIISFFLFFLLNNTGDIITIRVSNKGPYGMQFGPDKGGNGLIIMSWERLPGTKSVWKYT